MELGNPKSPLALALRAPSVATRSGLRVPSLLSTIDLELPGGVPLGSPASLSPGSQKPPGRTGPSLAGFFDLQALFHFL